MAGTVNLDITLYIEENAADLPQGYAPNLREVTGLELATAFHQAYERMAPDFGYETRKETRQFAPESPNGRLMTAVCAEIIERLVVVGRAQAT